MAAGGGPDRRAAPATFRQRGRPARCGAEDLPSVVLGRDRSTTSSARSVAHPDPASSSGLAPTRAPPLGHPGPERQRLRAALTSTRRESLVPRSTDEGVVPASSRPVLAGCRAVTLRATAPPYGYDGSLANRTARRGEGRPLNCGLGE